MIGNLLDTRKHEVVFVQKQGEEWLRIPHHDGPDGKEIEEDIIARLMELHEAWTSKGGV